MALFDITLCNLAAPSSNSDRQQSCRSFLNASYLVAEQYNGHAGRNEQDYRPVESAPGWCAPVEEQSCGTDDKSKELHVADRALTALPSPVSSCMRRCKEEDEKLLCWNRPSRKSPA